MEKYAKIIIALLLAGAVCSCSRIPNYIPPDSDESSESASGASAPETSKPDEFLTSEFTVTKKDYAAKLNAEGGVLNGGELIEEDEKPFDGKGFVRLNKGGSLSHIVTASAPQHYRVMIAARSESGAAVSLKYSDMTQGTYYIPPYDESEFGASEYDFKYYAVDNVYLVSGSNTLKFTVDEGSADIDYLFVESSSAVSENCYSVGNSCVNPKTSLAAVDLMQYLAELYGEKTLTAQNVTIGTNAEINAVFKETGRYPAIRVGELAMTTLTDEERSKRAEAETELALQWSSDGGICAYTWHWYSPNSLHGTAPRDFSLADALENENVSDTAMLGAAEIAALEENDAINEELVALLNDIDKIAEQLKKFDKLNIPLIFEPIPDADSGLYWWGSDAESYKKLWTLAFDRLCLYHGLRNLIWVWNGSNIDYYPGNQFVDIMGQSFYERSKASFAGRFSALNDMDTARKIQTVTACDTLPNIDYMCRDNAMWLWAALGSGEFLIDENGRLVETYNNRTSLNYFYNHELTITRDELKLPS
ncbi:MAG: hypothetical protein NC299_05810 [Lachnospiraceae bacterium]|nr:hypothetical protein [Ruminococcus sp.]MCM1274867.1 hypothetical protein [Lachnospiraceae bacterium]